MSIIRHILLVVLLAAAVSPALSAEAPPNSRNSEDATADWYHHDALAREISQISPEEYAFLQGSPLIDFRPVVLPRPGIVVSGNDYFDWPIATRVDGTILVLFDRRHYHYGVDPRKEPRADEHSGIRMIVRSEDGGRTWSEPIDVRAQAGRWAKSLFGGWGGGLGVHEGVVYLAINEGVYHSADQGKTWKLVTETPDFREIPAELRPVEDIPATASNYGKKNPHGTAQTTAPFWSPGMRLTFDDTRGLTIWTTRGFKPTGRDGKTNSDYGKFLCAVYSPDFGKTWHLEEQALPRGLYINEVTPLSFQDRLAFFFRNGIRKTCFGQGFSKTGWFPFKFAVTNVGPVDVTDTPDVIFNPKTGRLEAAVPFRYSSPGKHLELRLYSKDIDSLAAGDNEWRFDGILLKYKDRFGKSDGMNPVGGIVDEEAGLHRVYIWAGDARTRGGIFEYRRSLDTAGVRGYLKERGRGD